MKIASAYSVRLRNFCRVFDDTVEVYRKAVDFFIEIMLRHRDPKFTELKHDNDCIRLAEGLNVVNMDIAVKTANFIVKLANEFKVDVIVMEHRDLTGRKRGSKRQRLHHWRAKYVQQIVEHQAHRCGTRIRRVCSWNTSKLAFDGTGDVTRDTDNYSMCTFQTGKRYSCDLSASYNIGARYFLREYEKSISATRWRCIAAKVPSCAKRITRTLDTLIRVNAELRSM
mgnify:CR=1 FL=1